MRTMRFDGRRGSWVVWGMVAVSLACALVWAGETPPAGGEEKPAPPPRFVAVIGAMADESVSWQTSWMEDRTGITPAASAVLKLASDKTYSRGDLKKDLGSKHPYRRAARNLDAGRHDLLKHMIGRAVAMANERLKAAGDQPLPRVTTLNSGKTGDYTRDIDLTVYAGDEHREQVFLDCLGEAAHALGLGVDPPPGQKVGEKLSFPGLEVEIMRGSMDLPDARFATNVEKFAVDYRALVEKQGANPECYFGYGYELEVQERRSLLFKPGQTYAQEFIYENGKVKYVGQVASCVREARAVVRGAVAQRYRRAQQSGEIVNHFLQALHHSHAPGGSASQGAIKYAGRGIDNLCEYHGFAKWDKLTQRDRLALVKTLGFPGSDQMLMNMVRALDICHLTENSNPKAVPAEYNKAPVEVNRTALLALIFLRRASACTASSVAREMLDPPAYNPLFLAEKGRDPKWNKMSEEERRKVALADSRNKEYAKCVQVQAMENLLMIVKQMRMLDTHKTGNSDTTAGEESIRRMMDGQDGPTRQVLELAAEHADAAMKLQNATDPVEKRKQSARMKNCRDRMGKLIGVRPQSDEIVRKAAAMGERSFLKSRRDPVAGGSPPWSSAVSESWGRMKQHIEDSFPREFDVAGFKQKINAMGVKGYLKQRLMEETLNLGTVADGLQLLEMYQNNASNGEYARAITGMVAGRVHWSLGFFMQAAEVKNTEMLKELGKNLAFDAMARLIPGVGQFKLLIDIERGIVNVTVGYAINQLNNDLIHALYYGEAGRNPDGPRGMKGTALVEGIEPTVPAEYVLRIKDEKTGAVTVQANRSALYKAFFRQIAEVDHDDCAWLDDALYPSRQIKSPTADKLIKVHDRLLGLLRRQCEAQAPAWVLDPQKEAAWKAPKPPTEEEITQAMTDMRAIIATMGAEWINRPFAMAPREWIVKNADGETHDAILAGVRDRFVNDVLIGMMETWQSDALERELAKREIESMGVVGDVIELGKKLHETLWAPTTRLPGFRIAVRPVTVPQFGEVFDGAEPIAFDCELIAEGLLPTQTPDVQFLVEYGKLTSESGSTPKPKETVTQEITVRAVAANGQELASTKLTVRVRLSDKTGMPVLMSGEDRWGENKGPLREKYPYYEESAMKHPSMRGIKYKSEYGRVYHGLHQEFYNNGTIRTEQEYRFGIKHGAYRSFTSDGKLRYQGNFVDGIEEGAQINYQAEGVKGWEMIYENGKAVCLYTYYPKGKASFATKITIREMSGSKLDEGEYESYHENGQLSAKGAYAKARGVMGVDTVRQCRQGPWVFKREDGSTIEEGSFTDGLREGAWKFYHENGKPSRTGSFEKGREEGQWLFYDEKERLTAKVMYKAGKELETERTDYHANGAVRSIDRIRGGEYHGEQVSFYEDGQKGSVAHFTEGFCTDRTEYYKDGKVHKAWVNKKDGAGVLTEYEARDANGNVVEFEKGRVLGTDGGGQRTGPWLIVYGKERSEGSYEEGKQTGRWTHITRDGGKEVGDYAKGERTGPWRFTSSTGGLTATGDYADGLQTGRWEYYDSKGRNSSWTVFKEGRSVDSGTYKN